MRRTETHKGTPRYVVVDDSVTTWAVFDNEQSKHLVRGRGKFEAEQIAEKLESGMTLQEALDGNQ